MKALNCATFVVQTVIIASVAACSPKAPPPDSPGGLLIHATDAMAAGNTDPMMKLASVTDTTAANLQRVRQGLVEIGNDARQKHVRFEFVSQQVIGDTATVVMRESDRRKLDTTVMVQKGGGWKITR